MFHAQAREVALSIAEDLSVMRLPDLSDFTEQEIANQLHPMFSKSGLEPGWFIWLQEAVERLSHGLTTLERAPPEPDGQPHFFDVLKLVGQFGERLLVITQTAPYFQFRDPN